MTADPGRPSTVAPVTTTIDTPAAVADDVPSPTDATLTLIGLDGEMSCSEIATGGRLIQVGAAAWVDEPGGEVETFTSLIGYPADSWTPESWTDIAESVHGLTKQDIADAPPSPEVDRRFRDWLLTHGGVDGRRLLVPVGLNVMAFDMPFFRTAVPYSSALLSRRGLDVNGVLHTYAGWDPSPNAVGRDFYAWKRAFKTSANRELARRGMDVREHDAGYDAAQALLGWWWLRTQTTDQTARIARLEAELAAADPLRAQLGAGLLRRLTDLGVTRTELTATVEALVRAGHNRPSRWFGSPNATLGRRPLQAVEDGDWGSVRAAAGA